MLWQTELVDGELVYADLMEKSERDAFSRRFAAKVIQVASTTFLGQKCDEASRKFRARGNELYESGHFAEAISSYNTALLVAKSKSVEMGFDVCQSGGMFS